jgi:membrane associated rhomboid family serine protease
MVIRILGLMVGLLLLGTPFLDTAGFLDAAKQKPGILLVPILGTAFIAYGVGGRRRFSKFAPWLVQSAQRSTQAAPIQPDFQQRLERVTPKTYVTTALIAVNVVVFAAMGADGAGFLAPNLEAHLRWGANLGPLTAAGEWWRLATSTFLHFGVLHLALNMWVLYENGRVVERLYGNLHFLVLYLFAGIAGSLNSLLWHPMVTSAGASGAIFGVLGGLLAFALRMRDSVPFAVTKTQVNSTLLFIAYSLINGFATAGIDNAAHLGGLAGGFLIGLLLARPLDLEQRSKVIDVKLGACIGALVVVVMMSLAVPVDANDPQVLSVRAAYHAARGNFDGALNELDQAIGLNPNDARISVAYLLRAEVKQGRGDLQGALTDYDLAIQKDAKDAVAYNELAWLLATAAQPSIRDGRRALEAARKACELSQWKNAAAIDTLAAAYARSGDFAKAAEWQQKAAAQLGHEGARERLQLYRAGKAYPPD